MNSGNENTIDENVQTLLGMGFHDESNIRQALQLAKNDLNEAVSFLTGDLTTSLDVMNDVEMNDITAGSDKLVPCYPPSYDDAMTTKDNDVTIQSDEGRIDFPYECLVELEGRVFVDNWSIPFRKDESLAKCLKSATKLINEGLLNADENCTKFLDRCMPECFNKLLTSSAVQRWLSDVQEGIYDMLSLFIDLIVARLKHDPLPLSMLQILAMAFDPDCTWNSKNKYKTWQQQSHWVTTLGGLDKCYARCVDSEQRTLRFIEQRGWLLSLINEFCHKGGLTELEAIVSRTPNLDASQFAALLQPFSFCADWLNPSRVQSSIAPIIERAHKYVRELSEEDFKLKKLSSLSELLCAMKGVCRVMWADDVSFVDELRLTVTLRMMRCPHFNAKMNALKEVTKLVEECKSLVLDTALGKEKVLEWLVDKNVLRISLEGHIDQSQYCDKIRTVVQFIGDKLSADELTLLWKLQSNASLSVSENVQSIISGAAPQFTADQLDVLFKLIHKSWLQEDERARKQLVSFIGRIGHNSKQSKDIEKVLTLLWDLAHLPKLSPHLVELALREHHSILSDAYLIKDAVKKNFILRCIDDIKKDQWIVPALRQLQEISRTIIKQRMNKSDRTFLHDLNRSHDLLKLVVASLVRCHQTAVESSKKQGVDLNGSVLVDERYKHSEYVWYHLSFLKFLLKDGDLYLSWNRAKDIWDTLYGNPDACPEDRETSCDWFIYVLSDLEQDAIKTMFKERLAKVDVSSMNRSLFDCLIAFFENANVHEQKIKKNAGSLFVEKLDLLGIDILWRICLECQSNVVADKAISKLVCYSYVNVSQKLKKDVMQLHSKFLNECYKRLNACHNSDNGTGVSEAVTMATKTLTANVSTDVAMSARRTDKFLTIERLLTIVYTYISDIEAFYVEPRSLLPHGEFYRGTPITLDVRPESIKQPFPIVTHGNESVRRIRRKIANELDVLADHVQIVINDRVIPFSSDRFLLENCGFKSQQVVIAKMTSSVSSSMQIDDDTSLNNNALIEMEQRLPSVVLSNFGNRVYDILFQLSDWDQSQISTCVRRLLLLLPTDPRIRRSIENIDIVDTDTDSMVSEGSTGDSAISMESDHTLKGLTIDSGGIRKQRTFESLFRVCSPDMNLFRLRYNLEVLSGLLMPVGDDIQQPSLNGCESFVNTFLQCGGIHTILSVLQREIVSESVEQFGDADTKRGCYTVALNIAKQLLCVFVYSEHSPGCAHGTKAVSIGSEAAVSPLKRDSFRVGSYEAAATPTKRNRKSISQSPVLISSEIPHHAKSTVQVMSSEEFSSLIVTLVRIAWFASACKLEQLTANQDATIDGTSFMKGRRWSRESASSSALSPFRQASTSSVSSAGSTELMEPSYASRPHDETPDKNTDSLIASQALELLVSCLRLRSSHLEYFFELPFVSEFIIDVLTRPSDSEVRDCAVEQFYQLSTISSAMIKSPRHRLIQILVKARVPFWHQTTLLRAKAQSLVRNCLQFFTVRGNLLQDCINDNEQKACGVDEVTSLEEEISWLNNFEIPTSAQYAESSSARCLDNLLLTGHLRLIKILISSPKVNKKEIGAQLIGKLLYQFLFPASKLILEASAPTRNQKPAACYLPKCSSDESRSAAFDVLIELCKDCTDNLNQVASQLISMHHYPDQTRAKEFDFAPLVCERPDHGFVGLKNGGATCYMNSVIQQLYMVPDIAQLVLNTEVEGENILEDTVVYQLQNVFAHLHDSKLQFYIPSSFWKTFRLWGQEVNIREQQDAFEFFTDLTDQVDEYLKSKNHSGIFRGLFRGLFCDQKICEGCPHKYEREEPYFALNLPVKSGSLEDSLRQFVSGEKLEGDNAYFCEKCNEKRTATKRTCIKSLPPILTIQLKRFGYDWEASRSLKFDDYFRFPHEVDMQPYLHDCTSSIPSRSRSCGDQQMYRLVGIVIHSGQAQAGHYYSIVKDRRGTPSTNPRHGRWYKFNDTTVEEINMNGQFLEEECFGGTFTSKVYERGIPYDEERMRYWNAYLLFYERVPDTPTPSKGRVTFMKQTQVINSGYSSPEISPPSSPRKVNDIKLSQLTNLVKKGDQRGIFTSQIPSSIIQLVREENLQFMRNRGVYSPAYFNFIGHLAQVNLHCVAAYPAIAVTSLNLAAQFLFQTYFRTKRTMLTECDQWQNTVGAILAASPPACVWFAQQLQTPAGKAHVVAFLLECPNEVVRSCFANMLGKALQCLTAPSISKEQRTVGLEPMLAYLLSLLDKEVSEHVRKSKQFFELIADFVASDGAACRAFLVNNGLALLLRFLLGGKATSSLFSGGEKPRLDGRGDATSADDSDESSDVITRRWSSAQSREFHALHAAIINVILQLDMSKLRRDPGMSGNCPPVSCNITVKNRVALTPSVEKVLTGSFRKRYIRELLFAAREISTATSLVNDVMLHCCYDNKDFSNDAVAIISNEISSVAANELKSVLTVMLELLSMEDTLHRTRLEDVLEQPEHGFLDVIKDTQRRDEPKCYQCVKALVELASRNDSNRVYLLEISSRWSWSVAWLKRKMSEHACSTQSARSNESSTSKHFQRTMSAQHTLDEATALLAATKNAFHEDDDTSTL